MKNFLKNYVINPGVFRGDIPRIIAQDQQAAVNSMVHGLFRIYSNLSEESKKKMLEIYADKATIRVKKIGKEMKKKLGYVPPAFITITPTNQCNLNCKGCYYGGFKKDNKIEGLTYEQLDDILNQCKELGMTFINWSGGEDFLIPWFLDLLEKHSDLYHLVFTNGTLINEKISERLAKMGNVSLSISIEGFEKRTDYRRGKGTFKKIIKAMDLLKKKGVVFGNSITLMSGNAYNIDEVLSDEFIDMLIEKGSIFAFYFEYMPFGKDQDFSLMPNPEERHFKIYKRVREIRKEKEFFVIEFWTDGGLIVNWKNKKPDYSGCMAVGRVYMHINSKGDIEACVFNPFSVGNIKEKTIKEILSSDFFKDSRNFQLGCNPYAPCLIRDNLDNYEKILKKDKVYSAREEIHVLDDKKLNKSLKEYAKKNRKIANFIMKNILKDRDPWENSKDFLDKN